MRDVQAYLVSYELIRPLLFALPPELSHRVALSSLDLAAATNLLRHFVPETVEAPVECMGLKFRNRVGLAAGMDKNGDHIAGLSALGFGCIEVGTVTPEPQPGNRKPRLFRIATREALINRMGFNNRGLEHLAKRARASACDCVLGINIGRNKETPDDKATDDYLAGLRAVYGLADYVCVNISSPNTEGLRDMQEADPLNRLLHALSRERAALKARHVRRVPLVLKIAPDLKGQQIRHIAQAVTEHGFDGVIATNTTMSREGVEGQPLSGEEGGLSGAPLMRRSTAVLKALRLELGSDITLIGCGGIMDGADARAKREAGADLVQLYTGLIYRGPGLIQTCAKALADD